MCTNKIDLNFEQSTYKHDYLVPKLTSVREQWRPAEDVVVPVDKPTEPRAQTWKVTDVHTMQPWRKRVPFDLLWQPEPIIRTHPWQMPIAKITKPTNPNKAEAIKTRPRVIMAPAISMDDITDAEVRDQLCDYIYTTESVAASAEVKFKPRVRVIPSTTLERNADPVRKVPSIYHALPAGWKAKGKEWERHQRTALVNPTRAFWVNYKHSLRTPAGIDPFKKMITDDTRKEIRDLIARDELRLAYDKTKPGYTGYRPRLVTGQLRQQELTITKPDSVKQ